MLFIRMTAFTFLLLLVSVAAPISAADLRLERLAAYGHGGYEFWAGTPTAPVAVTRHTLEFIDLTAEDGPRRRASVYLGDAPLEAAAVDREFLWVQDHNRLRLLRLGVNNARTLVYFDADAVDAWTGDRSRLAVLSQQRLSLYRVESEAGLVLDHEYDVAMPVAALTLAGDRLLLQTPDGLMATSLFGSPARQFETLAMAEEVRLEAAGIAAFGRTVAALDQQGRALLQWHPAADGLQADVAVPLDRSNGRLAIPYMDENRLIVTDESDGLWLFTRETGAAWQLDRRFDGVRLNDVLPLDEERWLTGDAHGMQLRRRQGANLTVSARLEQGGLAGDIAVKGDIVYWVQDNALHVFDCSNPYQPQLLQRIRLGRIRRLQVAGDVLAILTNELFLFDIREPAFPQPGPTLYREYQDMALVDNRLATIGPDDQGRPELVVHQLDAGGDPHLVARTLVEGDPRYVAMEGNAVYTFGDFGLARFEIRPLENRLLQWEWLSAPGGPEGSRHMVVRDGRVFVLSGNGDVTALEADPSAGLGATVALPIASAAGGHPPRLTTYEQTLLVGGRDLVLLDTATPHRLKEVARLAGAGVVATARRDDLIFVSGGSSGRLEIVRVSPGITPLYVPWVSNSENFHGELKIVNLSADAQRLHLRAFAQDGVPRFRELAIPAETVRVWHADNLFPELTGYSLEITAPLEPVQVFYRRFDPTGSVLVPAVSGATLGSDLVFPCAEFGDLHRVLVVTPLAEGLTEVVARVQTLDKKDGSIVAEFAHPLKVGRAGIIRLPGFADYSARVQVPSGVRLVGEQFRFDIALRQTSVSGWSPAGDENDQAGLDLLDTWSNPNPSEPWRALQAVGERMAAAASHSISVFRHAGREIEWDDYLDGFLDIRDMAWRQNLMAVADAGGVDVFEVDAAGRFSLRHSLPVQASQVAVSPQPRPLLVTADEESWALYDLSADDLSEPAATGFKQRNSRFWLADGRLTVFEASGDLVVYDVRRPQHVSQAQLVQHGLLFEGAHHQVARQGNQLLWLHPRLGLVGLYQPWFPARALWAQARVPLFSAGAMAFSGDGVVIADRRNGLKLIDTANPFSFRVIARRLDLKPGWVAADGERIWTTDMMRGDVSVLLRSNRLPQTHFPYVPLNQPDLLLDIHQSGVVVGTLRWRAGTGPIPSASGDLTLSHRENSVDPNLFGAGADGWTSLSLRGVRPVQAWLSGTALAGRWARGLRDEELAASLVLPLLADQSRTLTVMDRSNGGELSLVLRLLGEGEVLVEHTFTLTAGGAVTHRLDQLFHEDELAAATALQISGPAEARLGAVVHLFENDRLKQLVTGTPIFQ